MGQILIRHLVFELAMMVTGGDRLAALPALATQNLDLADLSHLGFSVAAVNFPGAQQGKGKGLQIAPPPVIPGYHAPSRRLALGVPRRHPGSLPPAGGYQLRQLHPCGFPSPKHVLPEE